MSFVSQDSFLMDGTIKDNILLYSDKEIDLNKIHTSLKLAKADKFINELNDGIDFKLEPLAKNFFWAKTEISFGQMFL